MIITPASLTALMTGLSLEFQKMFDSTPSHFETIATVVPSSTKSNTYGWLGQFPALVEWVGDRVVKDMAAHGYTITNKDWESTVGIARPDIEDDNIGIYKPMAQEMGRAAKTHPDEQVFALLKSGKTEPCYDGQYFFDTDHPINPEVDGSGVDATVSNLIAGVETPWYLIDASRAIKPIIYQQRKKPVFTSMTALTDEVVFTSNQFRFGIDSRDNVGFGFWQTALRAEVALTAANLNTAIATMMDWTADGGRPLGVMPTHLIVPPSLRDVALEVVKAERNAAGATNVNRNAVEVLVTPWVKE